MSEIRKSDKIGAACADNKDIETRFISSKSEKKPGPNPGLKVGD
jgi:hypothetical protein